MRTIYFDGSAGPDFLHTCVFMDGAEPIIERDVDRPAGLSTGQLSEHVEWLAALAAAQLGDRLGIAFNLVGDRQNVVDGLRLRRAPNVPLNAAVYDQILSVVGDRKVGFAFLHRDYNFAGVHLQRFVERTGRMRRRPPQP